MCGGRVVEVALRQLELQVEVRALVSGEGFYCRGLAGWSFAVGAAVDVADQGPYLSSDT